MCPRIPGCLGRIDQFRDRSSHLGWLLDPEDLLGAWDLLGVCGGLLPEGAYERGSPSVGVGQSEQATVDNSLSPERKSIELHTVECISKNRLAQLDTNIIYWTWS